MNDNDYYTDSYAELIAIIDSAIVDYNLTVSDIANALQVYTEWTDMTGVVDLSKMLFNKNDMPLLPSDILYFQQLESMYMNGDNYDD